MKAVKKAFALYDKILKRYDPIISKCIHDNIFYSAVVRTAFGVLFVCSAKSAHIHCFYRAGIAKYICR